MKSKLKIALVHDYLKEYGGAESVFETLADLYPDAPIYTSLYAPQYFGPHRSRLEKKWKGRVHQSFFRLLPFAPHLLSPLRFLSPLAFKFFNFSRYDLIIVSATGAFFPNSLHKKNARLVCYCHTPPRYLYGLTTARSLDSLFYRLVNIPLQFILHFYRLFDFTFAQNVDQFIANSSTTAARIKKFYRRDSVVINPPVDVPGAAKVVKTGNYYLTGGRLARAKRYDIAIQACNLLNLPLRVFGRDFAGYEAELKKLAGRTVEFLGEVNQEQKDKLFSEAKAYIFSSDNEDFGIVSVEAMAHGCPVVGYNSGGIAETVVDGKTGVLFQFLTPQDCADALLRLQKLKIDPQDCITRAREFNTKNFIRKFQNLISSLPAAVSPGTSPSYLAKA